MKSSIFWEPIFIPVYFIMAFLGFILYRFYIETDVYSIYVLPLFLAGLGIASIIYNAKFR
ncbi:hypothetical protein BU646_02430 [Staphylococcus chromogenes]|uniref:hypothetical protein n=1 Tax=Staphylococcus sp. 11511212 TaxID=2714544 RepID=UPI000D02DF10|nr:MULTISPECIES: hypothetical protein [Staphylococcus]MDT0680370.1 hypothetical protein [Staphylococcus chromogenes]MDY3278468.1 hypothetical protein [Staphylococcus chromogenes]PTF56990.1 hypothetical protein BUY04_07650 [Staphylococcus chromogenes]PTF76263.1 hypothetical protein BUX97_03740 [Staphylococcus chromogenes]PTF78440.1 hypothetical protein BUY02_03375 [Staphylococcus chromogenes]